MNQVTSVYGAMSGWISKPVLPITAGAILAGLELRQLNMFLPFALISGGDIVRSCRSSVRACNFDPNSPEVMTMSAIMEVPHSPDKQYGALVPLLFAISRSSAAKTSLTCHSSSKRLFFD
jgi:hypothetical protein